MTLKARPSTLREKQIAAIADGIGVSGQSVVHTIRSLAGASDPFSVKLRKGVKNQSLSIEQIVTVSLAVALDRPTMVAELVPALAMSVPLQTEASRSVRSGSVTNNVRTERAEIQQRIDELEVQVQEDFRKFAKHWKLPGCTLSDALTGLIQQLTGEGREKYLEYYRQLRLDVTIFCQPFVRAEITVWRGEYSTVRTTYVPQGVPSNAGHSRSNFRRKVSIPLAYFEAIATLILSEAPPWRAPRPVEEFV